jgi:glycogen synthase
MHVLRLCSVFEAPPASLARAAAFDVVGGMQVHTARLTGALDDRGIDQTVITAFRPGAPRDHRLGARTRVRRVGVPVRHLRQLYGMASVPAVIGAARPDLVHVHLGEDVAIVPLARWAARRAQAPIVATVHCSLRHTIVPHGARSAMLRAIGGSAQLELLRSAGAVLVLTERAAELLASEGVSASRIRVVALGIDLDAARGTPRPAVMDPRPWVVYAGRLVREKGVWELIEAVGRHLPDAGLLVVGDGPERAALEAAVHGLDAMDRIRFVGAMPHAEVQPFLHHAEVVVLPSWFEERGRVLLEAMAAGTPVVATRTGGIPATVQDGVNGLLVPPRAPEALAAAIGRVLGDAKLPAPMGAAGRATAAEHSIGSLADATLATYETVLGRSVDRVRAELTEMSAP